MNAKNPAGRRDDAARDRLRDAQRAESAAVADVYRAEQALGRAQARHEAVAARSDAALQKAMDEVHRAQLALVAVSGRQRAAALLGIEPTDLSRPTSRRNA